MWKGKVVVAFIRIAAAAALLGLLAACVGSEFKPSSLYQRFGGKGGLVVIVDGWLARAAADAKLSGALDAATRDRIRPLLVEQLCELVGGPCRYSGRDMKTAHAGVSIDAGQYDAMLDALGRTMTEFRIPAAEQKALFDRLKPLRKDIVSQGARTRSVGASRTHTGEELREPPRQPIQVARKRPADEPHMPAMLGKLRPHAAGQAGGIGQMRSRQEGIIARVQKQCRRADTA